MLAEADNSIEENVFHEIGHLHSLLDLLRHLLLHKLLDQLLYRLQAVRYVNHMISFFPPLLCPTRTWKVELPSGHDEMAPLHASKLARAPGGRDT